MPEYILKLEKINAGSLGSVRCMEGLLIAEEDEHIWIKGIDASVEMDNDLKKLPVKASYIKNENDELFIPGKPTPVERLKKMSWKPLLDQIKIESPVAALPGKIDQYIKVKLIPSTKERKGKALLTSLEEWKQYAETAPGVRLERLKFAVSEKKEVLVIGEPLPSIPGMEFWQTADVLIPSGYDLEFDLLSGFIQQRFNSNNNSFVVFDKDCNYQVIDKNFFVTAKRSAVRTTIINDQAS